MAIWPASDTPSSKRQILTAWHAGYPLYRLLFGRTGLLFLGAGLLTGRSPQRSGIYDWIPEGSPVHLRPSEVTIARLLQQAGYATCQVGKWHLNGLFNSAEQPQPGDLGFDYWFSTQNNAAPTHHDPTNFVRNGQAVGTWPDTLCQLVADEAIGWLRKQRDAAQPFFQFVCFHEPHEPIDSPPELVAEYPSATKSRRSVVLCQRHEHGPGRRPVNGGARRIETGRQHAGLFQFRQRAGNIEPLSRAVLARLVGAVAWSEIAFV